jgi:protein-export membrane protein SecD
MDPKQQNILALVVIAILVAASWYFLWPPDDNIRQGLDIQGGLSVILTATETTQSAVTEDSMDRAEFIVRNRVDALGVSEASVQRQGTDSILVQLPGISDPEQALDTLGSTGQLEFVDVVSLTTTAPVGQGTVLPPGSYTPFLTGEVVTDASISVDEIGNPSVDVTFDQEGAEVWAEYTSANVGQQIAIVLDGTVQSAPTVREPILDGNTQISGDFTPEDAKQLQTVLETGALPVSLEFSESRVVGPTLGQDSLQAGLLAGLAGLALVAIYMALYYRGLGIVSWFSLFVFGSLLLGALAVLSDFGQFALSLPGVAGIVLTIGLAADSSILIFERFKEEVRMGKSLRSSAKSGTKHAVWTSLDADLTTFVTALVLYVVAIGPVRGFAFTLMLGVACDIIVMTLFTRTTVILLADSVVARAPWLFGVKGGEVDA